MLSVYALGDPQTGEIRYIGIAKDVFKRYAQHLNSPHPNKIKNTWMEHIKASGIVPTLTILEPNIDESIIHEREKYWIKYYLELNAPLTNIVHNVTGTVENSENIERTYSTLKEIAQRLSISERTVYRLIKNGTLEGSKIGREWRVEEVDFDNFIIEQRRMALLVLAPEEDHIEIEEEEDEETDKTIEWITPREASKRMTLRAGYVITPDDIKQMRRTGKFKNTSKLTDRIGMYDTSEVENVVPPNKRKRIAADQWEQALKDINEGRKNR